MKASILLGQSESACDLFRLDSWYKRLYWCCLTVSECSCFAQAAPKNAIPAELPLARDCWTICFPGASWMSSDFNTSSHAIPEASVINCACGVELRTDLPFQDVITDFHHSRSLIASESNTSLSCHVRERSTRYKFCNNSFAGSMAFANESNWPQIREREQVQLFSWLRCWCHV